MSTDFKGSPLLGPGIGEPVPDLPQRYPGRTPQTRLFKTDLDIGKLGSRGASLRHALYGGIHQSNAQHKHVRVFLPLCRMGEFPPIDFVCLSKIWGWPRRPPDLNALVYLSSVFWLSGSCCQCTLRSSATHCDLHFAQLSSVDTCEWVRLRSKLMFVVEVVIAASRLLGIMMSWQHERASTIQITKLVCAKSESMFVKPCGRGSAHIFVLARP